MPLQGGDGLRRASREKGADADREGRGSPQGQLARDARGAQAVVREGRDGDCGERTGLERRRERTGRHVAGVREGARPQAAGLRHRVRERRRRAEGFVLRPDRGRQEPDGKGADVDRRLRSDRGQRGVRRPGARRRACPRLGLGPRERERGRDRPRAPDRRVRRADPHDAPVRLAEPEANDRPCHPVSRGRQRRGPHRGDALMQAQTAVVSASSLARRRALAVLLGAALVAIAAQIAIPLPGTPVPMTLQPLAVLLVGALLGPSLGAGSMILYLALGAAGLPVFTPYGLPGLARLVGPTGGYLLAYPVAAFAVGKIAGDGRRVVRLALAAAAGLVLIHLGGLAQLAVLTGSGSGAVRLGTLPFLAGDLVKLVIAVLLLRPTIRPVRARL